MRILRDWLQRGLEEPLERLVGGPARLKVIVLLACVLGLDSADKATIGAIAAQLKDALHIGNVQVGLLVTASTAVGALVTLPFGILADRVNRSRLLVAAIIAWSLAMILNGASTSYDMLLASRLILGIIIAAASPAVVSLVGDFFRPGERGRIFGYIIAGELIGVAVGFLLSGNIAAILSWRAAFWLLALIGFVLAYVIWRLLPEPARGGQSFVPEGAEKVPASEETSAAEDAEMPDPARDKTHDDDGQIEEQIESRGFKPHDELVLREDPTRLAFWSAVRHVLSIRTYRALILASALGYFYFTGLRTFALVYMRSEFHMGQAVASTVSVFIGLGAIVGSLLVGRIGDKLICNGTLTGRIRVGAASYLLAAGALLIGLVSGSLYVAGPLFFIAAAGIGGANPAVDAARLDVMHSALWGRAEGVRATARYALEAAAPPLFGFVASWFDHHHGEMAKAHSAAGMQWALVIMLIALIAAGLTMIFRAARTYPRDVATALASERATQKQDE